MRAITVADGKYKIYEDGSVFRMNNGEEKPITFTSAKYYMVYVGKKKYLPVHRLIANAFVPNPHNYPYVNHIDGNKHNNAASNLEWVSPRENIVLAYCLGQRRAKNYEKNRERYEAIISNRYGKSISEVLRG